MGWIYFYIEMSAVNVPVFSNPGETGALLDVKEMSIFYLDCT